jgi:Interferon-induced transmembrane protein
MSYGNFPGGNEDLGPGQGGYGQYPGFGQAGPSGPPPNYLVWAILSTLFCCLPAGIVAIVFAAQVNGKWAAGDWQGAAASSARARTWVIVSAIVGVIAIVIIVAMGGIARTSGS